jgi:hypothetical protein
MMALLDSEIAAFEQMQPSLQADHPGKWIVIRGRELVGAYENFDMAAAEAVRQFGRGPYLIRQVGAVPLILPASAMYTFRHAAD